MKCPHCGNELKEGYLICEKCGEEIQIVPDFEPEIENSMTETLSTLASMQEGEDTEEAPAEDKLDDMLSEKTERASGAGKKFWVVISLVLLFVIAFAAYGLYCYHVQTVEFQIDRARAYVEKGSYGEAIACLEMAYVRHPEVAELLFLEADCYYLQQDNDAALSALMRIIGDSRYVYEDVEEAYDKMVTIYANMEQYDKINELLRSCAEERIVTMFQGYLAMEPEFSYVEGSYAEVIPLKLSSNTAGTIYYTTDGLKPDTNSRVYTAPIFLETGEYTISAFFVNDYGIESEVVTKTYIVNLAVPTAPEVELYSGEYSHAMMIAVEETEGCKLYYTTDESEPTSDSVPYTGPIPMPLGETLFKFVNISEEGISSEVTMRTYTLKLRGAVTTNQAVENLVTRLVQTEYLEDALGHNKRQTGTLSYQFSSVLLVGGEDYYTIYEYYDDGTGILSRTDKVFLVQVYTGASAQLSYDAKGNFVANPI